ncbi:MAG: inositol monophosphatase [SAR324 cluster bacterium]|nr:inositol monophosphatase [SAR324 cluster bacterium]
MDHSELEARYVAVKQIALSAGKNAVHFLKNHAQFKVEQKGTQDFVTQADKANEKEITEFLLQRFPADTVFGEEMGGSPSEAVWVVDPIDGTSNFIRGISYFCVSIAFVEKKQVKIGVVYDPVADELYSAWEGHGAFCNEQPIQASRCEKLSEALIGLGYSRRTEPAAYASAIERLMSAGCEYRRYGAAALMLAHAAAGKFDGFFEVHLNSWDALAGLILNQEAGAYVAPFLTENALTEGNQALVCSKFLKEPLLELL